MADQPWKTDRWFSSPWNYLPEVTADFQLPADLQVHDVTFRDGEQQAGVELNSDDKLRIAEALSEAGIHRIEAGLPAVSPSDEAAVRKIASAGFDSRIFAFSRCMVGDVELAADCGVEGVVMEIPSSHHLIEVAYRWPLEKAIEASVETTKLAHDRGLTVSFFPIDATRAGMVELLDDLETVARARATLTPSAWWTLSASPRPTPSPSFHVRWGDDSGCRWRPTSTWTSVWGSPTRSSPSPRAPR